MKRFIATEEQRKFIENNVKGRKVKELTKLFNEEFNMNLNELQIKNFKNRYNLKSGLDCCFKKGCTPYNKGLKGINGKSNTVFKKGHIPANHKPVGSERINDEGYVEIKVSEPSTWKLKHRFIWEKNNGKIPDGHILIFSDGDRTNLNIDNLLLITRQQLLCMNRQKLIQSDKELTKTGVLIADLLIKIGDLKKRGE